VRDPEKHALGEGRGVAPLFGLDYARKERDTSPSPIQFNPIPLWRRVLKSLGSIKIVDEDHYEGYWT
jgi:hypothetical protein